MLLPWIQDEETKKALLLNAEVQIDLVQKTINEGYAPDLTDNEGYAPDLTDDEIEQIGRDPFLIAYALVAPNDHCVVTAEVSKPGRKRQNRHLPDVCQTMKVKCSDPFSFMKTLGFKTSWQKP